MGRKSIEASSLWRNGRETRMEFRALRADEMECRVGTVSKSGKGLSLLLYKDARCDA
jgi:hypothetical protein